jgi:hypothetical protein
MGDACEWSRLGRQLESLAPDRAEEALDMLRELVDAEQDFVDLREHGSLLQRLVVLPSRVT